MREYDNIDRLFHALGKALNAIAGFILDHPWICLSIALGAFAVWVIGGFMTARAWDKTLRDYERSRRE